MPAARIATITDANVILGYLNPGHLVGGALKLNADKARAVFAASIAEPLGMSLEPPPTARTRSPPPT